MKKTNLFFDIFMGEFVEIITDLEFPQSVNVSEEGQSTEVRMPMIVNGFLLDMDDVYVYLSPDGESVKQALPRNSIKHIEIVDLQEQMHQMMDDIPEPEGSAGYN